MSDKEAKAQRLLRGRLLVEYLSANPELAGDVFKCLFLLPSFYRAAISPRAADPVVSGLCDAAGVATAAVMKETR